MKPCVFELTRSYQAYKNSSIFLKATSLLALLGFFICLHEGTYTLLLIIPDYLGYIDDYGDFIEIRRYFSFLFSLALLLALLKILEKMVYLSINEEVNRIYKAEYEKILNHAADYNYLTEEYEQKIDCLVQEKMNKYKNTCMQYDFIYPEYHKIAAYNHLISQVNNLKT